MKWIYSILKFDKLLHFFIGTILTLCGFAIFLQNGIITEIFILPLFFGIVKELFDYFVKKTFFSWLDLLFTNITAIILTLLILIIK